MIKKIIKKNGVVIGVVIYILINLFYLHHSHVFLENGERNSARIEDQVWAERQLMQRKNIDEKTRYINTTAFYYKVIGWYGYKPQDKKGMSKWTKVLLCQKMYEYEKLIGLPLFTFLPLGLMESNFDPQCKGDIGEGGWLQIHRQAVGQSFIFFKEMPKYMQKEFKFYYKSQKDLEDPLNCLKIAAVRMWGLNRLYSGNQLWIVSTYHWGLTRIWPLWKDTQIPKQIWKFYTLDRSKWGVPKWELYSTRNPMMYYFIWYEIHSAFSSGRKDVNVETVNYYKRYLKRSKKEKRAWINSWRYNQKLLCVIADFREKSAAYEETYKRMNTVALKSKKEYHKYFKKKKWKKAESIMNKVWRKLVKIAK